MSYSFILECSRDPSFQSILSSDIRSLFPKYEVTKTEATKLSLYKTRIIMQNLTQFIKLYKSSLKESFRCNIDLQQLRTPPDIHVTNMQAKRAALRQQKKAAKVQDTKTEVSHNKCQYVRLAQCIQLEDALEDMKEGQEVIIERIEKEKKIQTLWRDFYR